jgi:uncharacterized protein (TIRG00374 family)
MEYETLINLLKKAKYEYIVLSMAMGYAAFISRGIRWKYLLEPLGYKVNTWNSIHSISMLYFTNALIPRAGELARCTTLNKTDKVPVDKLFGTVIIERVIDFVLFASLVLTTFALEYDNLLKLIDRTNGENTHEEGGVSLKLILLIVFAILVVLFFIFKRKLKHHPIYQKAKNFWTGIKEGFKSISKLKNKWLFVAHTLFIWSMYFWMAYVVVYALEDTQNVSISGGLLVMAAGALGMIIPAPGGVGSYHYFAIAGMLTLGVSTEGSQGYALLVHGGQTLMTFMAGLSALIALYKFRRKNKKATLNND